ncbi:MAG: flavin-containing monooxygenase [Solirubrobacterales bacterium]
MPKSPPVSGKPSICIIGAGFGGIGLAIRLLEAGYDDLTIVEKADAVGGVWRDNIYPGLTCDVPSHLYSFSFEPNHDWTRRFPRREEIHSYLERCAAKYGLDRHLRLSTEVERAEFDEVAGAWRVQTRAGEEIVADVLVSATGQLSRPADPAIPGLGEFDGPVFHSGRWDSEVELPGRRAAVIGAGASAVQFVPEIAGTVERLEIFQRSPNYVVPKPDRPYRPRERTLFRRFPWIQSLSRAWAFLRFEYAILIFTRLTLIRRLYEHGYRMRLRREVPDPALRRKLQPDYPIGCKRVLISNDWLPALSRSNVSVVSEPIREITAAGILTADGVEHEADVLILGTGFAANDFLAPMEVRGLGGRDLNEAWRDGAEAYLGLTVNGFPNMFILYGPNTNLGAGSIVFMLESQINYVVESVRALERTNARWIDVRAEVQGAFNADVQEGLADTVWTAGCTSWYRTESGKVTNNWPGLQLEYRRRTRKPDLADYTVAS